MEQPKNLPQAFTTNQSIATTQPIVLIKTLAMANLIPQFPFSDNQIEDWSKIILKLRPQTTIKELETVFEKFVDGRSKWNHKESLPNIFRGIELLKINPGEFFDEEKQMKYRNFCTSPNTFRRIYENDKEF